MDITTQDYRVTYDQDSATVSCAGSFLLSGAEEYAPILQLLNDAAEQRQGNDLTLDLRNLEFLNSSGINTFTKFVIGVRNKQSVRLNVRGIENIPWQVRLLKNLQRLMPALIMQLDA
jgi:hypothetical protein